MQGAPGDDGVLMMHLTCDATAAETEFLHEPVN